MELCKALGKSAQQRYLLTRYIKLLKDNEPEVRVACAYKLGEMFRILDIGSATKQVHHALSSLTSLAPVPVYYPISRSPA